MAVRIQLRRDTAANWIANNPVLRAGEFGVETDTLKIKVGNGTSTWNQISNYLNVTPSNLTTELSNYILTSTKGEASGVASLDSSSNLVIPGASIIVEGSTSNDFETTLTVTDPTEDRTITFPNASGTVAFESAIPTDTDDLTEGENNLYYTNERVVDVIDETILVDFGLIKTYNSTSSTLTLEVDTEDIATRSYVDEVSQGLHIHASVVAATTINITDLEDSGSSFDGITVTSGDRVLVKDQTNKEENGIYVYDEDLETLVRAEDYDTAEEIQAGDFVFVQLGTTYASTGWVQINPVDILDTDPIEWQQFSGAGTFSAGTGLTLTGTTFSIDSTVTTNDGVQTLTNKTLSGTSTVWNAVAIESIYGGTGQDSYTTGDILYASTSNTLAKLAIGSEGHLLTSFSGAPSWQPAPVSLPSQEGQAGKYLTTDGTTASWGTLIIPIETGTALLDTDSTKTIDSTPFSEFTSLEYMVSLKQGSKVRTSKIIMQTDGTSVDMTEFAITETGGAMSGVVISANTSGSNAILQGIVTNADTSNVNVKFSKIKL
jgi:hypothetical protein